MATLVKNLSNLNIHESDTNNQYLYCTNTKSNLDTKLRLSDLIRTYRTIGSGLSLLFSQSNSEVQLKSIETTGSVLNLRDTGGVLHFNFRPANLDLSKCSNTTSLFLTTVDLTKNVGTTVLPTANGGTNKSSAYVVGDVLYASATDTLAGLAGVATGNALISGGVGVAPSWGKVALTTHVSGTLPVANGGTGVATLAARTLAIGAGTSAMVASNAAGAGQVIIGSAAGNPAFANIGSADSSVIVTNGNNTIDLASRVTKLELTDGTDMVTCSGTNTATATSKTFSYQRRIIDLTAATKSVTAAETGSIFTLNRAGGIAITLPAAVAGYVYEFHILTTFSGTCTITAASSADTYTGCVTHMDKDEKGSVVALNEAIDTTGWNIPAAADYILTLDADTDGRYLGGKLKFTALSDAIWHIEGTLFGDGTVSHIFS